MLCAHLNERGSSAYAVRSAYTYAVQRNAYLLEFIYTSVKSHAYLHQDIFDLVSLSPQSFAFDILGGIDTAED